MTFYRQPVPEAERKKSPFESSQEAEKCVQRVAFVGHLAARVRVQYATVHTHRSLEIRGCDRSLIFWQLSRLSEELTGGACGTYKLRTRYQTHQRLSGMLCPTPPESSVGICALPYRAHQAAEVNLALRELKNSHR